MFVVKECTKCKEYKLLDEFYKDRKLIFGVSGECVLCVINRAKHNYNKNKYKRLEYQKKKRIKDAVKIKEYRVEYYEKNKDRIISRNREYYSINKNLIKERERKYRENNKDKIKERQKEYRLLKKEHIKEYKKQYYNSNKSIINKYKNEWGKNRKKGDTLFKLRCNIRNLIYMSVKNNGYAKKSKTQEILGCDFETFKLHIERQFKKGMSWENYGEWHLDHIYPVSRAKDEQHLIELNHYTNFQPLWAKDNMSKGNKIIEPIQMKLKI